MLAVCAARSAFAQLTVPASAPAAARLPASPAAPPRRRRRCRRAQPPIAKTPCGTPLRRRPRCRPPGRRRSSGSSSRASTAQGNVLDRRERDLHVLHQAAREPAVAGQVRARTTRRPSRRCCADFKALWEHQLPRGPVDRGDRPHVPERRGRRRSSPTTWRSASASRSSTTATARQIDQHHQALGHRREAARAEHRAAARLVPRRGHRSAASKGVLRELMAEKGFTNAEVDHKVTPVAGGPKLVNVTFNVGEGPKIKIRDVDFVGNDGDQRRQAAAQDEGEQAEGHPLVHHRRRHLQGSRVRGRRREGRRVLPEPRLRRRRASASPSSRRSRTPRTARRAGSSCASR